MAKLGVGVELSSMRKEYLALAVLAVVIIFGIGYKYAAVRGTAHPGAAVIDGDAPPVKILVHVTGAVQQPGVYEFEQGARVNDAVLKAKPQAAADIDALNLAALLEDGQKILVPEVRPDPPASGVPGGTGPQSALVNINTADAAVLDGLPGIGPTLAQRIIQYRQEHGVFLSVDDLQNVPGIGESKMAELRPLITVR
ncbi:MAG: ComEA family DNA-binding protein [Bacillota bacterium]|uniref:helix-hairpin-helix domain-containing protein n=1 Tax=Desulforudis sp. DRI-14 TaxID=3459793 RepID=UPI0034765B8D